VFGIPITQITNIVQTLALTCGAGLVTSGYIPASGLTAIAAGIGGLVLLIYNILNHSAALVTPPANTPVV
jgi:hypothetical protein